MSMDLEHVVGFNNKDNGKPTKEDKEAREHEKNMVMINTNINQKKSDMNMTDFFDNQIAPLEEWTEDQYQRRDAKYDEQNKIIDTKEQLAAMLIKNGDLDEKMTGDVLMQYFENEEEENKAFNKSLSVGKKNNKELAEIDALKSAFGKKLFQAAGFSTGLTKPTTGRGTVSIKEDGYYRGMMVSYASLDKKGRQHFKDVYNNAFMAANVAGRQAAETGEKLTQVDQRQMIVDALNNSGLIDNRVHDNKNMQKIWGKGDQSFDKMFKSEADKPKSLYDKSPSMSGLKKVTDDVIKKAKASGDDYKGEIARRMEQYMTDSAEQFQSVYDSVPEEYHDQITDLLKKKSISEAKSAYYQEKRDAIDKQKGLSKDEKLDQVSALRNNPVYGSKTFNFPEVFDKQIQDIVDEANSTDYKYQTDELSDTTDISGERTTYTLKPVSAEFQEKPGFSKIQQAADKVGEQYGITGANRVVDISWGTGDGFSEFDNDPSENRKTAMDALRTWRNEVLPQIEPGTIISNDPQEGGRGDNQRERIYSLAGFGSKSKEGQFGLVVKGSDGKNKVVPLDLGKSKKKTIKEEYLLLLDENLDIFEECMLYEVLFS